jgi:hypothetical protein
LVFALGAVGFAACNTYDGSMLVGSLSPSLPAENAGSSGSSTSAGLGGLSAGSSGASGSIDTGGTPNGGSPDDAGTGGVGEGGDPGESLGGSAGSLSGGASGSAGAGGAATVGGAGGAGPVAGAAGLLNVAGAPSGSFELIDDFEDGDGYVIPTHGRNGPWYTFSDATVAGVLSKFAVALLTGANARDGSTAAAHLTASGFNDWGAGVGADLVNVAAAKVAYDVSAYKGVHFYAKVGSGASTALKLLVTTTYSDPSGGKCSDALPATVPSKRCSDHLYAQRPIKTTWAAYDVLFTELSQQGFGLAQAKLDPTSVYSLQFTMPAKLAPIDLWLDDVSFIVK